MDKYQASSSCPKLPSHMSGREMTAGSKERPKRGKRQKGYCPQQSRSHYCFVMCMTLLQKVDWKLDAVLAKVGQNEEMIRDLRGSSADIRKKVVKRGRSVPNNHYKFQGPMSIGGLQICGDGVNNFNLCSISKEWEGYGNFTNGQSSWKTSPPPDEKNQTAGNTRWTDRGSDSNARDCKMNHDNHAGWDVDKQGMSDIDDGGKISGLSDLPDTSGSDLIYDCSPSGASDGSGLTSILQSSPGQGSAQKTYPCDSLKSLKDLTSSDKEVNPKAAEEVGMPKKGTSLTVSSRQGSDSLTKASVEASSDERSDVGLGTETNSSARSENTGSLQGKTCSTGSDPLLAASQAINHTGSDQLFSRKVKLAQSKIQNECFSPKGKNTLAENLSQCQDGLAVSHQQTNNGVQRSENSFPSSVLDCEQTGNDTRRAPERQQTTQFSDCMQTASDQQECKRPQPCSIPSTVQTERGDWLLPTHMSETQSLFAEADGHREGVNNIAFRHGFKAVIDLTDSKKSDHASFSYSAKVCSSSPKEYTSVPLPVSEAGDGSKDFKGSHSKADNDATKCKQLMSTRESPSKVNDIGMKESELLTPIPVSVGSVQTTEGTDEMEKDLPSASLSNHSLAGPEKLESGTPFSARASGPAGQGNIRESLLPPEISLTASCVDPGNSAKGMAMMPSCALSDENDV